MGIAMGNANAEQSKLASYYGYSRFGLSTPNHDWIFGNDGVVNDANPQPCTDDDSTDIPYLQKIFDFIDANDDIYDTDRIYAVGFSQNSMFSAYTAFCFPDKVIGIWQGGSGLALTGVPPNLPAMQGQCSMSSYEETLLECCPDLDNSCKSCGSDCVDIDPCTDCQYWPIYPCYSSKRQMVDCLAEYTNDPISTDRKTGASSATYMYNALVEEGHDARLFRFEPSTDYDATDDSIAGSHSQPKNVVHWQVGCLGITDPCSATCEASLTTCMDGGDTSSADARTETFAACIEEDLDGCVKGCAPTYNMLTQSEQPTTAEYENFGAGTGTPATKPTDSLCQV